MNSVTCSSVSPSIFISTVFCCFPIVIVLIFSTLILSSNLWLLLCTSSVSSSSCPSSSATRSMSSVNLRLLTVCPPTLAPASVDFKAKLIIASKIRLNRYGDSPHPCLTPTVTLNHSVSSPSTLTALSDLLYISSSNSTSSSGIPYTCSSSVFAIAPAVTHCRRPV